MRTWDIEEIWATLMFAMIAMGGYFPILMNGLNSAGSRLQYETTSSPWSRVIIGLIGLGTLVPVVRIWGRMAQGCFALKPLVPYILLAVSSIAWSQDATVSLRKLLSFLLTCIFGLYLAVRFPVRKQLQIVLAATSLLAVLSVLLVSLGPQYAVDQTVQHSGAWQGMFAGKNPCAMVMVIGLAAAIVYRPSSTVTRVGKWAALALFALIIRMADSSGALVVTAILWISIPLLRYLATYEKTARALVTALLFLLGSVAAISVFEYLPLILRLLNRDPTLTGRTDIWRAVLVSIFKHPLLGYGYGAFWLGLKGESANVVLAVKWAIPNAHNGFLDIWLSLGATGLCLFGYAIAVAAGRSWQILLADDLRQNVWLISMVLLVMLYSLDESFLITSPGPMWTLLVSAVCGLEIHARRSSVLVRNSARPTQLYSPQLAPAASPAV